MAAGEHRPLNPFIAAAFLEKDVCEIVAVSIRVASAKCELHAFAEHEIGKGLDGIGLGRPGSGCCAGVAGARCKRANEANNAAVVEEQRFAVDEYARPSAPGPGSSVQGATA